MKKIISLIVLTFGVVACGSNNEHIITVHRVENQCFLEENKDLFLTEDIDRYIIIPCEIKNGSEILVTSDWIRNPFPDFEK